MEREKWFGGLVVGLLIMLVGAQPCFAGGFALYQGSARGNALEGTLVGRGDDPSAIFFNPAGITQLPGLQAQMGATVFLPTLEVTTRFGGQSTTTRMVDNTWVTPNFYSTYQFSENVWLGLGLFSQFGLGTEFDENWPGRYNGYEGVIQSLTFNPNIALKLNDRLSAAIGLDVIWFDLLLKQKIDASFKKDPNVTTFDADQALRGDSFGYGFNAGLHYKPLDWMALGVSYRSQVKVGAKGEAEFIKPAGVPGLNDFFNNTGVDSSITLPDILFTGLMVKPMDRLSIEFDAVLTRWSSFDKLVISYDRDPFANTGGPISRVTRKDWRDVWRYAVGVEYNALDWLDLRASYVYDETPDPSRTFNYLTPVNDCQAFSMGPGFRWKSWTFDLSYTFVFGFDRSVPARLSEGVLESEIGNLREHLIGLNIGYRF
jgi:long-chain fatty acid transport protein